MRKKYLGIFLLGLALGFTSCKDDDEPWQTPEEEVKEERNPALESWSNDVNVNIDALQAIASEDDYILTVKPQTENGKEVGICVSFLHQGEVVIRNGENGATGGTPVVGVVKTNDGYVWTLNGEQLKLTTKDGKPMLKAGSLLTDAQVSGRELTAVYLSVDGGNSWKKVTAPAASTAADYIFSTIDSSDENEVKFTLNNGTAITVPRYIGFTLLYNGEELDQEELTLGIGEEAEFEYTGQGVKVSATINGEEVTFTDKKLAIDTGVPGDYVYTIKVVDKDKEELTFEVTVHVVLYKDETINGLLADYLIQTIPGLVTTELDGKTVVKVDESLALIEGVTALDLSNLNLTTLEGLKYFINLKKLNVANNLLPNIDPAILAAFPDLEELICDSYGGGAVTRAAVKWVRATKRRATRAGEENTLDVSNNPKLKILSCSNNKLAALLFPKTEETFLLESLNCAKNEITVLEVTVCTELKELVCSDNNLKDLDLSKSPAVETVDCSNNNIEKLDLTNNSSVTELNCSDNNLQTLDVSVNVALTDLNCSGNSINNLDLSNNEDLKTVQCNDNKIEELTLPKSEALEEVSCSNNKITTLDVSVNVNLKTLDCASNQITELNVSENKQLENLACNDNQITSLDISANDKLDVGNMTVGDQKKEDGSDAQIKVEVSDDQREALDEIIKNDNEVGEGNGNIETTPVEPENPGTPDDPNTPDNPNTPDDPNNPEDPENPENPENPGTPDNPDNPENPDTPDNPDNPENPENPDDPEKPDHPVNPPIIVPDDPIFPPVPPTNNGNKGNDYTNGGRY